MEDTYLKPVLPKVRSQTNYKDCLVLINTYGQRIIVDERRKIQQYYEHRIENYKLLGLERAIPTLEIVDLGERFPSLEEEKRVALLSFLLNCKYSYWDKFLLLSLSELDMIRKLNKILKNEI